eukprot:scaffold144400_cov112-Phaeocystis_antarctica.AAC.1
MHTSVPVSCVACVPVGVSTKNFSPSKVPVIGNLSRKAVTISGGSSSSSSSSPPASIVYEEASRKTEKPSNIGEKRPTAARPAKMKTPRSRIEPVMP